MHVSPQFLEILESFCLTLLFKMPQAGSISIRRERGESFATMTDFLGET